MSGPAPLRWPLRCRVSTDDSRSHQPGDVVALHGWDQGEAEVEVTVTVPPGPEWLPGDLILVAEDGQTERHTRTLSVSERVRLAGHMAARENDDGGTL